MKSIIDSTRYGRNAAPRWTLLATRDLLTVLAQGLTVLRIAGLVLVLYVKFKLELMRDRRRDRSKPAG